MKVRVVVTLDIDAESWQMEYGVSRAEVREDVKAYVQNNVQDHFRALDLLTPED